MFDKLYSWQASPDNIVCWIFLEQREMKGKKEKLKQKQVK